MSHRQHGTRVKYVIDRCRCRPCTDASTQAERAINADPDDHIDLTVDERAEAARRMAHAGRLRHEIGRVLHMSGDAVKRLLEQVPA